MDRAPPVGSKICARRMEQRRLEMHHARVKGARPLVDTSEPSAIQMEHIRNNLKREQMLEERYSEIDRENRILLKKMSEIMKQANSPPASARQSVPQSLNRDARKKELLRITKDNQSILRRIQQAQPVYNHVEWEGTNRRNLAYLKNCAEFPLVLRSARGRTSELMPLSGDLSTEEQRPVSARSSSMGANRHEDPLDHRPGNAEYVLKEGRTIGDTYYLLEMATDGRTLSVTAYDGKTNTTLELLVKERVHRRLYRETNGDYAAVAQRLAVEGGRLVLAEGGSPTSRPQGRTSPEELDAEAMVVYASKTGSAGSVNAQIDLGSSGEPQVRLRGLTPSTAGA